MNISVHSNLTPARLRQKAIAAEAFLSADTPIIALNADHASDQKHRRRVPILLFPSIPGSGSDFVPWAELLEGLAPDQPFYAARVPLQFRHERRQKAPGAIQEFTRSLEAMAEYYIHAILNTVPEGPLVVGGYSAGVILALEVARQLTNRHDRDVPLFVAIDWGPSNEAAHTRLNPYDRARVSALKILRKLERDFIANPDRKTPDAVLQQLWREKSLWPVFHYTKKAFASRSEAHPRAPSEIELIAHNHPVAKELSISKYPVETYRFLMGYYDAIDRHETVPYPGDVVVIVSEEEPVRTQHQVKELWTKFAPQSVLVRARGGHVSITQDMQHARPIVEYLNQRLADISERLETIHF